MATSSPPRVKPARIARFIEPLRVPPGSRVRLPGDYDPSRGLGRTQASEAKALLQAGIPAFEKLDVSGDEATGAAIVKRALEEPLKQIAVNAGFEGGVVVERVRGLDGPTGLNAATGDYEDLFKAGVIDAAKVTRSALQNAASIAALFLTTEAVIADKPEKEAPMGGMPGGGMEDF